ncbi:MAG: 3-dehydroquinate synthase [Planctomycetota bacterium]|jgi:3-dehydroquinate synthase
MAEGKVLLGSRSYEFCIEWEALTRRLPERAQSLLPPGTALILSDSNVEPLYGDSVRRGLEAAGRNPRTITVPAGESSKSLETVSRVWDQLLASGADRSSSLVLLGGGVVGDLGGFAASTYMRGIPFWMIPTSLLAQIDASVGGKVAVNLPQGKNLVGLFAQPLDVLVDPATLGTLPVEEFRSGMEEAVKAAMICDADLFAWLEDREKEVLALEEGALVSLISRCLHIKAGIVAEDERETTGTRALLNLGHTVGHAVESVLGFGTLRHGEAVAIGMVAAATLAETILGFPHRDTLRVEALLTAFGLPTRLPPGADREALLASMGKDKKNVADRRRMVLPLAIGNAVIREVIPTAAIRDVLGHLATA